MNDLYLVVLRLRGWEFMEETPTFLMILLLLFLQKQSLIYAKQAVRSLAAEQHSVYEEGQNGGSAVPNALPRPPAELDEMSGLRLALKRKAEDSELQVAERKLQLTERFMTCMEKFDPQWRNDILLQMKAKTLLLNT
jgi:hypothetical protein